MPVQTVPRFEDPAFAVDARDPNRQPEWGVAPKIQFDQPNGQLLVFNESGQFILANPAVSLEQLIVKALITNRLQHRDAYGPDFGSDFWVIIGRRLSNTAIETLAEKFTREALAPIDLIRVIDQFFAQVIGDTLYISFRVVPMTGHEKEFSFARVVR